MRFHPDGRKFAISDGEGRQTWTAKKITLVDLENRKSTTLTAVNAAAQFPAWSPNGDAIAFVAAPDAGDLWGGDGAKNALNQRRIWIMNPDGSQQRQLISDANFRDERPIFSADGKSVIFFRIDRNNQASLWSIPASGGEPKLPLDRFDLDSDEGWFGVYGYIEWSDRIAMSKK